MEPIVYCFLLVRDTHAVGWDIEILIFFSNNKCFYLILTLFP